MTAAPSGRHSAGRFVDAPREGGSKRACAGPSAVVDVPPDQVDNRKTRSERGPYRQVRGGTMERGRRRPSPLTVGVTLVVGAVAVLGFVLTDRSEERRV